MPTELGACLNAHGLYNSVQFVLRLSPEVHRKIAALPGSGILSGPLDFDSLQAFSTYLHETIHWWQHIGSISGLMLSLSYPVQMHGNYNQLKSLLASIGPKKSILNVLENSDPVAADTRLGDANFVLNSYFDIEFFRILTTNPMMARQLLNHRFFDCVGHSYQIAYGNVALTLASTLDQDFSSFPDPRRWREGFSWLRANKKRILRGVEHQVGAIGRSRIVRGPSPVCSIAVSCLRVCLDAPMAGLSIPGNAGRDLWKGIWLVSGVGRD